MKKVLITGGNGYIGKYLCKHLKNAGYDITITSRNDSQELDDFAVRKMDLIDVSSITDITRDMDIVIHTANLDERLIKDQPQNALIANAYATRQLYLDSAKHGVEKFVYFSTFHVYGKTSGNIDESTLPEPLSDYGMTHYFGECYLNQLTKLFDTKAAIVRLTNGIGAPLKGVDKWYLVSNDFCKTVFNTGKIVMKSNGLPLRDFVAIDDVAEAIEIILKTDIKPQCADVYNISSQQTYSIRDVVKMVSAVYFEKFGKTAIVDMPSVTQEERNKVQPLYINSEKLRKLGWKSTKSVSDVIQSIFMYLEEDIQL